MPAINISGRGPGQGGGQQPVSGPSSDLSMWFKQGRDMAEAQRGLAELAKAAKEAQRDIDRMAATARRAEEQQRRQVYRNNEMERRAQQQRQRASDRQYRDERGLAEHTNRDIDIRRRLRERSADQEYRGERSIAEHVNRDIDIRRRLRQRASDQEYKAERGVADHINRDIDMRRRLRQKAADDEYRKERWLAEYIDRDVNRRRQQQERSARQQKRGEDQKYRDDYSLANRLNQDENTRRRLRERAALGAKRDTDKKYLADYAEAQWMNQNQAVRERQQAKEKRDADTVKRLRDRAAAQAKRDADKKYLADYAEAQWMNQNFNAVTAAQAKAAKLAAGGGGAGGKGGAGAGGGAGGGGGGGWKQLLFGSGGIGGVAGGLGLGGFASGFTKGGLIGIGIEAAKQIAMAPQTINAFEQQILGASKEYMDFRTGAAALGRSGGFGSLDLMKQLYPGNETPSWMKMYGYTPESAMGTLGRYGIPPTSADNATNILKSIGKAELMPGMGLSKDQLASHANLTQTLGVDSATGSWWYKLREVMTFATANGMDHARTLQNVETLMKQAASAGAQVIPSQALANTYMGMAGSGAPGMRSGEGITAALAGMDAQVQTAGVGGNPVTNMAMARYFKGGLPTGDSLRKFLNKYNDQTYEQMMSTGSGKSLIKSYEDAVAAGNTQVARTYMGQMLLGQSALWQDIISAGTAGMPGYMQPLIKGRASGAGVPGQFAWENRANVPNFPNTQIPAPPPDIARAIDEATVATNMQSKRALLYANMGFESGFNPTAHAKGSSASGLGQFTADTWDYVKKKYGYTDADRFNPTKAAEASAKYTKELMEDVNTANPNDTQSDLHTLMAYELGKGTVGDVVAGRVPSAYVNKYGPAKAQEFYQNAQQHAQTKLSWMPQYQNLPTDVNASTAAGGQISMNASEQAWKTLGDKLGSLVGDNLQAFGNEVNRATVALTNFVNQLLTHPSGALMPHGIVPRNLGQPSQNLSPGQLIPLDGYGADGRPLAPAQH